MLDQRQIEGQYIDLRGIVVVFVAALILRISGDLVIDQEGVVEAVVVGRGVKVRLWVAIGIGSTADLGEVHQSRRAGDRVIHLQSDVHLLRKAGSECAGQHDACPSVAFVRPVCIGQRHVGRQVIGDLDVGGRDVSLVEDRDAEVDQITGSHVLGLPRSELLDQGQIEGLNDQNLNIAVVFIAAILAVSVHVVVFEEGIIIGVVVGRAVHVFLRVAVRIGHTADFSHVANFGIGRQRAVERDHDVHGARSSGCEGSGQGLRSGVAVLRPPVVVRCAERSARR